MRKFPKSVLRARIIKRAGMENDPSIDATNGGEWDSLMSEMYGEIYEAAAAPGLRYFEYSTSITTSGLQYLSEPADILSLVDTVERVVDSSGRLQRITPIQAQERAMWAGRTGHARVFEFVDDRLYLYPTPPSGDTYQLRYIPQSPDLTVFADTDLVDVVCGGGEAALIWGTALMGMSKDKSSVELAIAQRDRGLERLVTWAADRFKNLPPRTYVEDEDPLRDPRDRSWWYGG
jgi:hypothetical protein